MKTFVVGRGVRVFCKSENTRYGFRHLATLEVNRYESCKSKICYYNRTWECYEFESVLQRLCQVAVASGTLSDYHQKKFKRLIKNGWRKKASEELDREFGNIAMIAKMGDIFGSSKKERNDWKVRMLKAGLGDKGLVMPDDWDELDEDAKQIRLDAIINHLKKEEI